MRGAAPRAGAQPTADGDESRRRRIGIGECVVVTRPAVLATSGLGSCVGICLHDGQGRAGLAHCMLPSVTEAASPDPSRPAKYVDAGVEALHDALVDAGASPGAFRAKIAGGSDMLGLSDGPTVGERNVATARTELEERGIPIAASETGGGQGRSLAFEAATGRLRVTAAGGSETVL